MMPDRLLLAILCRLAAALCLTLMIVMVKLVDARGVSLVESLFYRQTFAIPFVVGCLAIGPGLSSVRTPRFRAHLWRTIVGMAGMALNFLTFTALPLAEATVLMFTVPIFATLLSAILLRETVRIHRWTAVLVGFAGVIIVAQPGGGALPLHGIAIGLAASVVTAFVSITLRQLGRTESAATTVFWFSCLSAIPLGVAMLFLGKAHDPKAFALLAALGFFGGLAQLLFTASLRLGPVSVVLPMDYSNLLWSTLLGWLIFATLPTRALWLGAPLIIASGLYIVYREHKVRRERAATALALD